jgi:hypothetical protein
VWLVGHGQASNEAGLQQQQQQQQGQEQKQGQQEYSVSPLQGNEQHQSLLLMTKVQPA